MAVTYHSSGAAARQLGITRHALRHAFKSGAPETSARVGNHRIFSDGDIDQLRVWLKGWERRKLAEKEPLLELCDEPDLDERNAQRREVEKGRQRITEPTAPPSCDTVPA